ncbi:hypothetical protein P153DRAFT_367201 [Dothidotthia symphoricarpi CBS 119687]|uniref:Uncharacterized protein n=1 Tax=Dothidotthia symphoricarpi CBS 119687 TaxID=1392245 RepID=A0A6A6AAP8_9PLEO|nr:uncharacterized protein P153DRAFT_367201 [Dothidotthia symphoricarpi CBS 119687]KAF2128880.1 hypothetical protein P153DRAFT_367201 [Dothidotthia symphoricarpi CBS 119687]
MPNQQSDTTMPSVGCDVEAADKAKVVQNMKKWMTRASQPTLSRALPHTLSSDFSPSPRDWSANPGATKDNVKYSTGPAAIPNFNKNSTVRALPFVCPNMPTDQYSCSSDVSKTSSLLETILTVPDERGMGVEENDTDLVPGHFNGVGLVERLDLRADTSTRKVRRAGMQRIQTLQLQRKQEAAKRKNKHGHETLMGLERAIR